MLVTLNQSNQLRQRNKLNSKLEISLLGISHNLKIALEHEIYNGCVGKYSFIFLSEVKEGIKKLIII